MSAPGRNSASGSDGPGAAAARSREPRRAWSAWLRTRALLQRGQGAVPTLAGRIAVIGANAALVILLSRVLSAEIYGHFITMVGATLLLGRAITFGCDFGVIRLTSGPHPTARARELSGAGLALIVAGSLVVATGMAVFASLIQTPGPTWPVWLLAGAGVGGFGSACLEYAYSLRLANGRYASASAAQAGSAVLRVLATFAAVRLSGTREAVFATFALSTAILGVVHIAWAARGRITRPSIDAVRTLLRYSAWQGAGNAFGTLGLYQGVFLLTLSGETDDSGRLGLAVGLCTAIFALYQGLNENFVLRAIGIKPARIRRFLGTALQQAGLVAAVSLFGVVALFPAGAFLFGQRLWDTGEAFLIYGLSAVLVLMFAPFEAVLHYAMRPSWVVWSKAFRCIAIGALGLLGSRTASYAAWAQVGGTVSALVCLALVVNHMIRTELEQRA